MAGVLSVLFYVQEKYKIAHKRRRYTDSIFQELDNMREMIWPENAIRLRTKADNSIIRELPHSVYDGLVSSATISALSVRLQRQLDNFYRSLHKGSIDNVADGIGNLIDNVLEENQATKHWWKFWRRINKS